MLPESMLIKTEYDSWLTSPRVYVDDLTSCRIRKYAEIGLNLNQRRVRMLIRFHEIENH